MDKYRNLDRFLKVGPSCFYMNISSIYECNNNLYLAFAYCNFDFLYNKEKFLTFNNPKKTEEYISNENELIIFENIDSIYMQDLSDYLDKTVSDIYDIKIDVISSNINADLKLIKERYLDNNIPVFTSCDHYYVHSEYLKITNNMLHFHSPYHKSVLLDINFDKKNVFIIDKFHNFVGELSLDNYYKSLKSSYIKNGTISTLSSYTPIYEKEERMFLKYLAQNINLLTNEIVEINNSFYNKNIVALKLFKDDFEEIITTLHFLKDRYAPQFLSKLLSRTILQKMSFSNLMNYYNNKFPQYDLNDIVQLSQKSSDLWRMIDVNNDKTFLSNKSLFQTKEKYINILTNLIEVEEQLIYKMQEFVYRNSGEE